MVAEASGLWTSHSVKWFYIGDAMLLKNLEKSERAVEGADLVFSSNEK